MRAETSSEKKAGRPRDERARRCVLDAVRRHLREGGLCGLTMEGIAREAGVGKQTLYRWWPGLADVALEALMEEAGAACPIPDSGDLAQDLRAFLQSTFRTIRQHTGPLLRCLIVEAQKNAAFREKFLSLFIRSRQEALGCLLARHGAGRADPALLVDMVYGVLWYRLLVRHAELDDTLADQLAQAILALWGDPPGAGLKATDPC
ncbi:MAG TPA: TetR/AcrR family transcriptional regulator [Holophaga sp.]|nr:TetR/AcrR family transcriptional regulator [Holophaga sp.]